jgi:preprotein translocase subunit SecF
MKGTSMVSKVFAAMALIAMLAGIVSSLPMKPPAWVLMHAVSADEGGGDG